MLGIVHEDEAMAGRGLRTGDAGHGNGAVPEEAAAELFGKIAQGLLHGSLLSLSEAGVYNAEMMEGGAARRGPKTGVSPRTMRYRESDLPDTKPCVFGSFNITAARRAGASSSGGVPRATGPGNGG